MKQKWTTLLILAAMLISLVAGCSNTASNDPADTNTDNGADVSANSGGEISEDWLKIDGPLDIKTVGISFEVLNTDFGAGMAEACKRNCEERGWEYYLVDANGDSTAQLNQCEDLLTKGIDLLIIKPLDEDAFGPISMQCKELGVPIVVLTTSINTPYTISTYSGQYDLGLLCADLLMEHNTGTAHKTLLMRGPLSYEMFNVRAEGMIAGLEAGGYEIVQELSTANVKDEAMVAVEDFISTGAEFDSIICATDGQAVGAATAVEEAGLSADIFILGNGGSQESAEYIRDGLLNGTVYMQPYMYVDRAFEIMDEMVAGNAYEQMNIVDGWYMDLSNYLEYYPEIG